MPNLTDESTAIALALVQDAHRLLRLVANRDLQTTHGTFVQMGSTMGFADRRLEALRRGLFHDLEKELHPERFTFPPMPPNPYQLRRGSDDEGRLSDQDLFEETRHYYWWYTHEPNPLQRWNVSKRFSELRRKVVARGYEHDAWTDGTEEEQP